MMAELDEKLSRLQAERQRLEIELDQLITEEKRADEQREGSPFGKREEGGTEAFELEKRVALKKQLTTALLEINKAIEKIVNGTYGICDACKGPIEPARLEALPQATLCLKCKSRKMRDARIS